MNVSLGQVNQWEARAAKARVPFTAADRDNFVRSDPGPNPLSVPANFPGLTRAASDLKVTRLHPGHLGDALKAGLQVSGQALTGIPGAVLTVQDQDGKLTASLRQGDQETSVPVSRDSSYGHTADVQLPGYRSLHFLTYDDISVYADKEGAGFSATFTDGAQPRLRTVAAHDAPAWHNLARLNVAANGQPTEVVVGSNQGNVHSSSNQFGFSASERQGDTNMLLMDPPGSELFYAADQAMNALSKLLP